MEENIKQFLAYCERTGKRPEKVNIDGKTYVVEWHPNKMFKRIYPKPLNYEDVDMIYLADIPPCQGTSGSDASKSF